MAIRFANPPRDLRAPAVPRRPVSTAPRPVAASPAGASPEPSSLSEPRAEILVVEDHDDLGEAIEVNLRRDGHVVRRVRDGLDALHAVRQRVPALIVLDLNLPRLDGLSTLAQLRQDRVNCPVLILSARGTPADRVEGFRVGADDYVTKPFHTLELVARVRALLRRAAPPTAPAPVADSTPEDVIGFTDPELVARFGLTLRQAAIARLMARGLSNPQIAETLAISHFTARNHANQVLYRLGVPTRGHVAAHLRAAYDASRAEVPPDVRAR